MAMGMSMSMSISNHATLGTIIVLVPWIYMTLHITLYTEHVAI